MPKTWFYHPWLKSRGVCRFPDNVRPRVFRRFLEKITKVQGLFDVKRAALECNVTLETARKYLKILCDNGCVKIVSESPLVYIVAYTPFSLVWEGLEEEVVLGLKESLKPLFKPVVKAVEAYLDGENCRECNVP